MMRHILILVAGGSGSRMGTEVPKQFLPLGGKPVLLHTLEQARQADPHLELIVVLPSGQLAYWDSLCTEYACQIEHRRVAGGASRYQSVRNGIHAVAGTITDPANTIIGIHDGVRPVLPGDFIRSCYTAAAVHGTAIPFLPVTDSLREMAGGEYKVVDRSHFILMQTPQCFRADLGLMAYQDTELPSFTDDASVLECAGLPLHFVPGERWNIKITFPGDLVVAKALLS